MTDGVYSFYRTETAPAKKGGKQKDTGPLEVVISNTARTKKKFQTHVTGLGKFGLKLPDTARVFAKKFAAASSVAGPNVDEIIIQGEVMESLAEFIVKQWPVRPG